MSAMGTNGLKFSNEETEEIEKRDLEKFTMAGNPRGLVRSGYDPQELDEKDKRELDSRDKVSEYLSNRDLTKYTPWGTPK